MNTSDCQRTEREEEEEEEEERRRREEEEKKKKEHTHTQREREREGDLKMEEGREEEELPQQNQNQNQNRLRDDSRVEVDVGVRDDAEERSSLYYEYKDLEGNIQGPFPLTHLKAWNRDGYLSRELEVRRRYKNVNEEDSLPAEFTTLGRVLDAHEEEGKEEELKTKVREEDDDEHQAKTTATTTTTTTATTLTSTLLDERLKNVFGGIGNGAIDGGAPFAFGGSFLGGGGGGDDDGDDDNNAEMEKERGDDDLGREHRKEEENQDDEEEAMQHALRLLEEEEEGRDAEEETSKAKAKRNQVLEQFEDERENAKFDVDERTSFGKHPKEIPTVGGSLDKGKKAEDPRLSKEAAQLRKLCKQSTKALLLPTHELLMSAATRTFVMDRNDDEDNVDEDGVEKIQRPRKEYENENERDEALEEEVKNVRKGLLSKLHQGEEEEEQKHKQNEEKHEDTGAAKKRRKSVEFDLKEENDDEGARSDGERSDISWGAKMGTYEDPTKRSRALSSAAEARKANVDDGDEYADRDADEDEELQRDRARGRKRTSRDDDEDRNRALNAEEKMKEEARKRQRALEEEEEAERQRQRQILLEKEEEENKRVKHIEFMKYLHKNPTAGDWWLPNEEDGKPTLGPFQWAELSVNLPGVRVAHRYEDNRWQFVGNVNDSDNLIPFVPLTSKASAAAAAESVDNPPELAVAKKMERENVFLPRKEKPLDDDDEDDDEGEKKREGEENFSSDGEEKDDDGAEKEASEEGLVEDGEVYSNDDDDEEEEEEDDDDEYENSSDEDGEDVALLESDEENMHDGGDDDDDDDEEDDDDIDDDDDDDDDDKKFTRYLDIENTHEWFRRSMNAYDEADDDELKRNDDLSPSRVDEGASAGNDNGDNEEEIDDGQDQVEAVKRWFRTNIIEGTSSYIASPGSLEVITGMDTKRGGTNTVRFKRFENLSQISAALSAELYESIMMNKAKKKIISQLVEEVLDSL